MKKKYGYEWPWIIFTVYEKNKKLIWQWIFVGLFVSRVVERFYNKFIDF